MTTNDMDFVIEKLAGKIGLAADKISPIAQSVVDQYVKANAFGLYVSLFLFLVFLGLAIFTLRKDLSSHDTSTDQDACFIVGRIASLFGMLTTFCLSFSFGYNMLTPVTTLLKM